MAYRPRPIKTSHVELTAEILELTERLARHAHDVLGRQADGRGLDVRPGEARGPQADTLLIPYHDLPDEEKQYDRELALQTLKAVLGLGYRIEKAE